MSLINIIRTRRLNKSRRSPKSRSDSKIPGSVGLKGKFLSGPSLETGLQILKLYNRELNI